MSFIPIVNGIKKFLNCNKTKTTIIRPAYEQLFHKKMIVQTLHGALECAVFAQNIPNAQIESIGPTVIGAHTPDEAVNMKSVADYWNLILALLRKK